MFVVAGSAPLECVGVQLNLWKSWCSNYLAIVLGIPLHTFLTLGGKLSFSAKKNYQLFWWTSTAALSACPKSAYQFCLQNCNGIKLTNTWHWHEQSRTHVRRKPLSTVHVEHCNGIQWMQYAGQRQLWFRVVFFFFPQLSSLHTVTWDYHWLDPSRMNANVKKKNMQKKTRMSGMKYNIKRYPLTECKYQLYQYILHCHFIARPQVIYSLRLTHKNQKAQVLQELMKEKESVLFSASKTSQAVWTGKFFIVHQQSLASPFCCRLTVVIHNAKGLFTLLLTAAFCRTVASVSQWSLVTVSKSTTFL